ncbi:(d)CMP kinase [bacterium]|nr:MAG: (d)CMP kinase [bacterium]
MSAGAGKKGAVIAIDGPSGVGKTTVAKLLAKRLNYRYVDTGAMYRAFAVAANTAGIDLNDNDALKAFADKAVVRYGFDGSISVNNKDLTGLIRTQEAGALASVASSRKSVRDLLVRLQRELGLEGAVVMEGRDIGTVVFPSADVKFFLDASHNERVKRRHLELIAIGLSIKEDVSKEIEQRDKRDTERAESPLTKAEDAVFIDTGALSAEGVVEKMLAIIKEKGVADIHS